MLLACAGGRDLSNQFIPRLVHHQPDHHYEEHHIARGSSLDRDLEGFPLNHVEVDQRGHDDCVVVDDGDVVEEGNLVEEGDVVEEGGLHDA